MCIFVSEITVEPNKKDQKEKQQKTGITPKKKATPKKSTTAELVIIEEPITKEHEFSEKNIETEHFANSPPDSEPILNKLDFPAFNSLDTYPLFNNKVHHRW